MTPDRDDDEALDWAIRAGDARFADWEALTDWLAGDPGRAARYHHAAAGLADMTEIVRAAPGPIAPPVDARPRGVAGRRWIVSGALAAGIAGLIGWQQLGPRADPYRIETAAGTTRTLPFPDGSRVVLAGATAIVLDRADARVATLERGQAAFTIRHDDAHPFRLTAGGERMIDTGTVFDVAVAPGRVTVAVGEGGVRIGEGRDAIDLAPGQRADLGAGARTVSRMPAAAVGAWTTGQLSYAGAPIGEVAAAVARALGFPIAVAPAMATRPFSGTLSLSALRRDPAALGPLLGGVMTRQPTGWELRAGS